MATAENWKSPTPQHLSLDAHLAAGNVGAAEPSDATPCSYDLTKKAGQVPISYRYQPTPPSSEADPDSPPLNDRSRIPMAPIAESPQCTPVTKENEGTSSGFACLFCQKTFRKRSLLSAHERIHQNLRPFKCDQCPKDFRDFGALSSHKIRLHSREFLKFSCTICTKRFRYERELDIHQRMHSGSKPYHCGFCNKSFTQLGNQRSHVRRHFVRHGFVKFPTENSIFAAKCVLCNETFNDGVSMEAHTKVHISDADVFALKEKTTNVLWSTGGSIKASKPVPKAAQKMEEAKENGQATASQNNTLAQPPNPQVMSTPSPGKRNDYQAAFTLAALLGGQRPENVVPMEGPPKGLPFGDLSSMSPQMAANPMVFPVANHGGASGYYVYVPANTQAAPATVPVAVQQGGN